MVLECAQCRRPHLSVDTVPLALLSETCAQLHHQTQLCVSCAASALPKCPLCGHLVPPKFAAQLSALNKYARFGGLVFTPFSPTAAMKTSGAHTAAQAVPPGDVLRPTGVEITVNTIVLNGAAKSLRIPAQAKVYHLRQLAAQAHNLDASRLALKLPQPQAAKVDEDQMTLAQCGVVDGATVFVYVVLHVLGSNLRNVRFELSWGYPPTGQDYLDGTCLAYNGTTFVGIVDYRHRYLDNDVNAALRHSGDMMGPYRGSHIIDVNMERLPPNVTTLFFALSAWTTPIIGNFEAPAVTMYDQAAPDKALCNYVIKERAGKHQAVIMCAVICKGPGGQRVLVVDQPSTGTARNYSGMQASILQIARRL